MLPVSEHRRVGWLPLQSMLGVMAVILTIAGCSQGEPTDTEDAEAALCSAFEDWTEGVEAIVFLEPDSTPQQVAAIETTIAENVSVEYLFVDKTTAFAEFRAMFRDPDQLQADVSLEDMPVSFRLRMTNERTLGDDSPLVKSLRDEPAVMELTLSADSRRGFPADC